MRNAEGAVPPDTVAVERKDNGFIRWIQEPMGSIIASTAAIIGSFGFVLSGTWLIQLALN